MYFMQDSAGEPWFDGQLTGGMFEGRETFEASPVLSNFRDFGNNVLAMTENFDHAAMFSA